MITIVTPAYNRAGTLPACFASLQKQTDSDFQWLIIDDGSTDGTKAVVESFLEQKPAFSLEYHHKENGGKHTALNESYQYIRGEYCCVLDSDDILEPFAVEEIKKAWERWSTVPEVGRVIFLKGDVSHPEQPVCYVKNEGVPVNSLKEKRISVFGTDCFDTFRTELFTKYRYPVFEGEKFIGEGAAWLFIEFDSLAVYINKVIYLCEYRNDGLTKSGRKMFNANPQGGMYGSMICMDPRVRLPQRIKNGLLYSNYSKLAKLTFRQAYEKNPFKCMMLLTYLPGVCLYHYWRKKYHD